jgi:hypothetical protein
MEEWKMERIKRFFLEDSATAEGTSVVIMVAAVLILFGAGLAVYYGAINTFFDNTTETIETYGTNLGPQFGGEGTD